MYQIKIFFISLNLLLIPGAFGIKKVWKGSTSFENVKSWENERPPSNCSNQVIKFPSKLYTSVQMTKNIDASEIILSSDGGLLLGSDMTIALSDQSSPSSSCEKTESVFVKPFPNQWFSVYSWEPIFDSFDQKYNKATPDTHWIPCEDDIVVFPNASTILVDVNFAPYLNFREVQLNGKSMRDDFQDFLSTDMGASMFLNAYTTTVNSGKCSENKNCPCDHQDFLCENVNCDEKGAYCVNPILPAGFCCPLCGAYLTFEVANPGEFDMRGFLRAVERTLSFSQLDKGSVEYFISFQSNYFVQLVVVDKVEGSDVSGEVMNYLRKNLVEKIYKNTPKFYAESGKAFTPGGSSIFYFLFLPLLCVTGFLGAFYVYHYENRALSRLMTIVRTRQFPPSQFIFARFDNQRRDEDGIIDIDVVAEEDVEEKPSSFNNPLYENKLNLNETKEEDGESSKEETELKETEKTSDVPQIEVTTFDEVDLLGPNEE